MIEEWTSLQCGQCAFFKVDADMDGIDNICKRLDHKKYRFAVPWFKSYDCGQFTSNVCRDFVPAKWCLYLYEHWVSFDDYFGDISDKGTVSLVIDGDTSVRYMVKRIDFINGEFLDAAGNLKRIQKCYYKRVKVSPEHPTGYILVYEKNPDLIIDRK